jgi:hypothetical protein
MEDRKTSTSGGKESRPHSFHSFFRNETDVEKVFRKFVEEESHCRLLTSL